MATWCRRWPGRAWPWIGCCAIPHDARQRVDLLMELRRTGGLAAVQAVVQRAARLAEKGDLDPAVLQRHGRGG